MKPEENVLYYGDNLDILRRHIKNESVDLIYLDPPFKSNQDYNVLFAEQNGTRSKAQIKVFEDTWRWDIGSEEAYREVVELGGRVSQAMQAFRTFLGENDTMAYLSMMAPRLIELRRVLRETGSIYLHCDPTASHYLKMLMDSIFDPKNFVNEIVWHYRKWPSGKYTFQRNHDIILFYSKSDSRNRIFNQQYMERAPSTLKRFGKSKIVSGYDEDGLRIPSQMADEESEGVRQDDVWDIGRVPPIKQLFPTQKPEPLLRKIIDASTKRGQMILDPFCGCGTTIVTAQEMKRNWIGIDITYLAITLIKHRLADFGNKPIYNVVGEPVTLSEAQELAKEDPYQFQWWALGLVNARPIEEKRGADKGIDGRIFFYDDTTGTTKQIIISVKSGHVTSSQIRDLRGVVQREKAQIGVFITLEESSPQMKKEAATAGFYESKAWAKEYPVIQIVTIKELLADKRIEYPPSKQVDRTFKKSSRQESKGQPEL